MRNTKISLDPVEQTAARYRLFARAIKLNGRAQIAALHPFLQTRLERSLWHILESKCQGDGNENSMLVYFNSSSQYLEWTTLRLAPLMSNVVSGMLGVYMFGEVLSKSYNVSHNSSIGLNWRQWKKPNSLQLLFSSTMM